MLLMVSATMMADTYNFLTITAAGAEESISLPVVKKITFENGYVVINTSEGNHSYPLSILDKMTFTQDETATALETMPEQTESLTYADGKLIVKGSGLLRVYNASGAMISVAEVKEGANISMGNVPAGVYVVSFGEQTIKLRK